MKEIKNPSPRNQKKLISKKKNDIIFIEKQKTKHLKTLKRRKIMKDVRTKREILEALVKVYGEKDVEVVDGITAADIVAYAEKTLEQLNRKNAYAADKAAEKKAAGDALRAAVQAVLTDEYQSTADILEQIEGEDLTAPKITARLTQLVKAGIAVKEQIKVGDRKLMGYKLAGGEEKAAGE